MKNPFKFGKEVSGYQFYDRKEAVVQLHRRLVDGSSNIVIFAPRRYGKTSVVMKTLEELRVQEGMPSILFDLSRIATLEQFCEEYAKAIYALVGGFAEFKNNFATYFTHLHPTITFAAPNKVSVSIAYGEKLSAASITEVLDLPEKLAVDLGQKPIVVAFDEFQDVGELSREFPLEKIFRSCIQTHKFTRYVFLGSKTHLMKRMFGEHARAFYKAALPMPLRKPPEEESREFLISHFAHAGIRLLEAQANAIIGTSENIPYYLQAIASMVFERAEGHVAVEDADISKAVDDLVALNTDLNGERLRNLSAAQRMVVEALAREPVKTFDEAYRLRHRLPTPSTLHSALKELVESSLVEFDSVYHLGDPILVRHLLSDNAQVLV